MNLISSLKTQYHDNLYQYLVKYNLSTTLYNKLIYQTTHTNDSPNDSVTKYTDTLTLPSPPSDITLYKKPWAKLNIVHKIIKIKEYINNLQLSMEEKIIQISHLTSLLKAKKLSVEYDINNCIIISIKK